MSARNANSRSHWGSESSGYTLCYSMNNLIALNSSRKRLTTLPLGSHQTEQRSVKSAGRPSSTSSVRLPNCQCFSPFVRKKFTISSTGFMTSSNSSFLETSCSRWTVQWNLQNSGNLSSALQNPTNTPFTDPSIDGVPSLAISGASLKEGCFGYRGH